MCALSIRLATIYVFKFITQFNFVAILSFALRALLFSFTSDINNTLEIYPNPFRETVVVNATKSRIRHVEVLHLHGQSVKRETCDEYHFAINLKDQADGFYLARVEFENGTTKIKKLCKNGN